VTVITLGAPTARADLWQATLLAEESVLQLHPDPLPARGTRPGGMASTTATSLAAEGPLSTTEMS
jgi:hypothetical protein